MNRFPTYLFSLLLLTLIPANSSAQGCIDSVRLYGFASPDYTFHHGSNISQGLSNGKSVYVMGRSSVAALRTSEALCVIDSTGKVLVAKSFTLPGQQKFSLSALTSFDGSNLLATGAIINTVAGIERATGVLVIFLDADLNLIWTRIIRSTFDPANDGEYSLNGVTADQDGRSFLSFHNNGDFASVKRPVIFYGARLSRSR